MGTILPVDPDPECSLVDFGFLMQVAVMRNHADVDVYVELLMSHGASVQAAGPVAPSPLHTVLLRGWGRGVSATQHDMKLIKLFLR